MTSTYTKAYTEVLEILKYLPEKERNKIPSDKIDFYKKNKDNNYKFHFEPYKSLKEQNISREANAIIVSLFKQFFATPNQQETLQKILLQNEKIYQNKMREKYNPNDIFKKNIKQNNNDIVKYKESIFKKIINKLKNIFNVN